MVAAIPEAVAAAGEGGAAAGGVSAGGAAGAGARAPVTRPGKPAGGGKAQGPATAAGAGAGAGAGTRAGGKKKKKGGGRGRDRQYQPVILAEFLVAVIVVAVPPLATGGDKTAKAKGGPSPYSTDTLKQLIAVGAVYFVLALLSGSKKVGRFTGWFGGLVLLGIGLLQVANQDLTALFKIFGPSGGINPAEVAADQPLASQDIGGAVSGALGSGTFTPVPSATGLFPVIQPGGQITTSTVAPPPGGTGVTTTTGNDAGANLAGQAGQAVTGTV
jgi:hypothetical protein